MTLHYLDQFFINIHLYFTVFDQRQMALFTVAQTCALGWGWKSQPYSLRFFRIDQMSRQSAVNLSEKSQVDTFLAERVAPASEIFANRLNYDLSFIEVEKTLWESFPQNFFNLFSLTEDYFFNRFFPYACVYPIR